MHRLPVQLVLAVIMMKAHAKPRITVSVCKEPENLKLTLLEWHQESSKLDVEPSKVVESFDELIATPQTESTKICDQTPSTDPSSTVMERSLCPWSWRSSYDESREPKTLTEAFCQCRRSRGNSGSYCMPIRRQVPVLKRTHCDTNTGFYVYEKSVHWITVGCHSVLPRSQRALPIRKLIKMNDDYIEV
ncbi:unnamed protein product [Bursaphelenchus okinawaensis]|uniref:Uncharacterized protein n=1 Tax=Bursaphelenchus okinawaensis TaxID=465554 RepID=A0A811LEW1_9BILA|nr:unnamed protein product [Bursaphelenchus okinawaensis]CAG9121756.1 unnamed protein product [Bursaphelenchus okinawaensis]